MRRGDARRFPSSVTVLGRLRSTECAAGMLAASPPTRPAGGSPCALRGVGTPEPRHRPRRATGPAVRLILAIASVIPGACAPNASPGGSEAELADADATVGETSEWTDADRDAPLASAIQFRVTYANGRGVRGAVVELTPNRSWASAIRWVTDDTGFVRADPVPRGEWSYRLTSGISYAQSDNWDVSPPTRIEGVVSTDDPDSAFPVIRIEPVEGSRVVVELSDLTGLDPETLPPGRIISLCRKWGEAGWSSLPVAPTWTRAPAEDDAVIAFETASAIPAGTYSIGVRIPGRILASSLVELPAGSTERVRLSPGPRGPSISFRLSGPESMASRRLHVSFNPIRDRPGGDVVHCMVPPDGTPTEFSGLRPGAYVALIWDLGLARTVSIGSDSTELSLELPPESPCPVGTTSLAVDVIPGRRRLPRGFLVAIRPNGNDERADDGWSAFRAQGRSFDAIAPGSYEVRVYNGALGAWVPGRAGVTSRRVDVAPAGTRTLVDLEPEK